MNDLKPCKLGDILTVKHGFPFLGEYFSDKGDYIVLTPGNFFETGGFKRIEGKEKFYLGEFPNEYLCFKNDLIVAMTQQAEGLLGSTALIPVENVYLHNQRIGLISFDEKHTDKLYLYYLFMTPWVRQQIRATASGSKVKHTSPERIYDVKVWIPKATDQKAIGEILYNIDSKITLNNAINAELEKVAKTLYNYWFVQFDFPNAEGNPYRASGGKMVYNDVLKREIPEGWGVDKLKNVTEIVLGGTPDTQNNEYWGKQFYWLNSGEVAYFPVVTSDLKITQQGIDNSATKLMPCGTTVVSITGNIRTSILGIISCANQSVVGVYENESFKCSFFYPLISNMLQVYTAISTGNCQTHINKGTVEDTMIVTPPDSIMKRYNSTCSSLYELIINNALQSKELTELRDFLLPLLMNGQVKVGEISNDRKGTDKDK